MLKVTILEQEIKRDVKRQQGDSAPSWQGTEQNTHMKTYKTVTS